MAEALEEYLIECSINKVYGSETEGFVVDEEVQIFGGMGYIQGNHPELAYRNARINRIWEGTNEINRVVIANTLIRRSATGEFNLKEAFPAVLRKVESGRPAGQDERETLDSQKKMIRMAKDVFLYVFGTASDKFGKELRGQQQVLGILSDMVIEIWACDCVLLRSERLQKGKGPDKRSLTSKMTKVLFHDAVSRIGLLARSTLESMEEGEPLEKGMALVDRHLFSPPVNVVALRTDIADAMIRNGRYSI
jgi:alkylation response protein AidB-like acyl-CoA dehydrogenase